MPHTALGIFNVTLITRNDVNMDMQDTLSSRLSYVNADVVAVGFKLFVQQFSLLVYQRHAGIDLFGCQLKKAGNMAARDDHRMTWAHRVGIARAVRQFVIPGNPSWLCTKQTWVIRVPLFSLHFLWRQASAPFVY
jgi:hypothetical protein